jgi:hypothetical protein
MIEALFTLLFAILVVTIVVRHRAMKNRIKNISKTPPSSGSGWKPEEPTNPGKPGDSIQPK